MNWSRALIPIAFAAALLMPAKAQPGVEQRLAAIEQRADERGAVLGNPNGAVVLYEFFDYNCPACRAAYADLDQFTRDYPDLKIVLVEWPILGAASTEAAQEALSHSGAPYVTTYRTVMSRGGRATAARIESEAQSAGGAHDSDASIPVIRREIAENQAVANALGINAAPGFYIDGTAAVGLTPAVIRRVCGYSGRGSCASWVVLVQDAKDERARGTGANVDRFLSMALADARRLNNVENFNTLCWEGALLNAARSVMPACDAAVAAAPNNANYRDSRGLARALLGDRAGAIDDFQAFIARNPDNADGAKRRRAVELLSARAAPSNRQLISILRD